MRLNRNLVYKLLTVIAVLAFLMVPNGQLVAETADVTDSIEQVHAYYQQQPVMDEWEALAARWSGLAPAAEVEFAETVVPSDYARAILASIATDKDTVHISGLITAVQAMQVEAGCFSTAGEPSPTLNQTVWPLIALDSAAANGHDTTFNRETAVNYIIAQQSPEGGFDESGWGVDVDSTAHALISLAPYKEQYPQAKQAIDQALIFLHSQQIAEGGFGGWGAINPDSTAVVIEALISLGIDPAAPEWVPADKTMVDALLKFQSDQGWFVYSTEVSQWNDPTQPNPVSTRNALLALGDIAADSSKYQSTIHPVQVEKEPVTNWLTLLQVNIIKLLLAEKV